MGGEAEETTAAAAGADYQDVTEAVTEAAPEAEKGADYQERVAVELSSNKLAGIIVVLWEFANFYWCTPRN